MPIDYSKYPPNWKTEIVPRILKRANGCCEECDVPNYALIYRPEKGSSKWELAPVGHASDALALDGHKLIKIILTIAHLNHDKENFDVKDEELKALCQRCHLNYDRSRHSENRKYGRDHRNNNYKLNF